MIKSDYYVLRDIEEGTNWGTFRFGETAGRCPECNGKWYYDYVYHNWFCLKCKTVKDNFNGFQIDDEK